MAELVNIQPWTDAIGGFRAKYSADGACELDPVTLVADHDPTLHFTNSSTSVMRPYLEGDAEQPSGPIYVAQPAMGSQGIQAWLRHEHFGKYASYFHSLGALYPANQGEVAGQDMLAIVAGAWGFDNVLLRFDTWHTDDLEVILPANINTHTVEDGESRFRHTYGSDRTIGRNANLRVIRDGKAQSLGSLTLIERDGLPYLWEVSFDSTQVVSVMTEAEHPIDVYPVQVPLEGAIAQRVATDAAVVSASLCYEGLEPKSRGKNGLLRKFFKTYVALSEGDYSATEQASILEDVWQAEHALRDKLLKQPATSSASLDTEVVLEWVRRLRSKH